MTSIVNQIQTSIISEAELILVNMKEMQKKRKRIQNIHGKTQAPPQTMP
jgi:hypothetical protein